MLEIIKLEFLISLSYLKNCNKRFSKFYENWSFHWKEFWWMPNQIQRFIEW